jgi:hypothetical protein
MLALASVFAAVVLITGHAQAQDAEVRLGPELAPNPGFERMEDGFPAEWQAARSVYSSSDELPHSGDHCLQYTNEDPERYRLCSTRVPVEPGRRYQLSGWLRSGGLSGEGKGATMALEWFDADGKYIDGIYLPGVNGEAGEWTRQSMVSTYIDSGTVRARLACYVSKGVTGTAWFDDVSLRQYKEPLASRLLTDAYRDIVDGREVEVAVALDLADYGLTAAEISGRLAVLDEAGEAVKGVPQAEVDESRMLFRLDATGLPVGEYLLRAHVSVPGSEIADEVEAPLTRVAELPERTVTIDEHQRLIVDGDPFFPLGMYWAGGGMKLNEERLAIYDDAAFNCLIPYGKPNEQQMDLVHERGLKLIYTMANYFYQDRYCPPDVNSLEDEERLVRETVRRFRDHPALLAWYLDDEPASEMVPRVDDHQRWVHEEDPNHPTYLVHWKLPAIGEFAHTADVLGTDPYPVPKRQLRMAYDHTRATVAEVLGVKPVWQVPQAFNWASYRVGEADEYRSPTLAEMRSMAWQCIVGGAKGLLFYSWFDLWKMHERGEEDFHERWGDVKTMVGEIEPLTEFFLSTQEPPEGLAVRAPEAIAWRAFALDDEVLLATVNLEPQAAEAEFALPGGLTPDEVCVGASEMLVEGGSLRIRHEGMEPVVVRLSTP